MKFKVLKSPTMNFSKKPQTLQYVKGVEVKLQPKQTLIFILFLLLFHTGTYADTIPIKLHPTNSHYFEFRGEPTILITSAEQYSAVQNLDFDYVPYLDELEDNGLNLTRIFCGMFINGMAAELPRMNGGQVYIPVGAPLYPDTINADLTKGLVTPFARSDSAGYYCGGNKFDLDTWDTLYFNRLADFVSKASDRGIVVEVTFFCGYGGEDYWKYSPMNYINNINNVGKFGTDYGPYDTDSTNIGHLYPLSLIAAGNDGLLTYQEAMVEKHIEELKDFDNVYFEPVNEPYFVDAGNTVINQNGEHCGSRVGISSEWQAHIMKTILNKIDELDNDFLVAQNIDHFYEKVWLMDDTVSPINVDDFRDIYSGVDILNFHYGARYPRYIDRAVLYNYALNRPIGQDENGYVGGEDHTYRKQGWNYIIGGGGIYNNLDLSYTTDGFEGGQPTNPSAGYGGSPELHEQYGILKEFIHDMDFIFMTPNNDLPKSDGIITEVSDSNVNVRCLANAGVEYAIYVEGGAQIDLTFDLPAGIYKAEWINTKARGASGEIVVDKTEVLDHAGDTVTISSPAYTEQDIALRLFAWQNTAPVIDTTARAQPDTLTMPNTVNLSVYASDTADGDPLNFLWSKTAGPGDVGFSINDTTISNLTTAAFDSAGVFQLQVAIYDPFDTVYSQVYVTVFPKPNGLPVIDSAATANMDTLYMPGSAELSVYATDPNGDTLKYLWTKTSGIGSVSFNPNDTSTSNLTTASFALDSNLALYDFTLSVDIYDNSDTVTDLILLSVIPECDAPDSLSATGITANSADLSWSGSGLGGSWQIMLGNSGFDTAGATPVTVGANPHTWTNLSPSTTYEWYIKSNCDYGTSSEWVGPHSFTTADTLSVLPFTEDWESNSGMRRTNGLVYADAHYTWTFETDNHNEGRSRWGTSAHLPNSGSGALTLDKYPNDGDYATNSAILTIDLSAYTSDDLELNFFWADHKDEEQAEDKVWIRGDSLSPWVEIFDFDPVSSPDGVYQQVSKLDIDQTLASATPTQTVSATFQLKFTQKDNSFTPGDGISIDDISITSLSTLVNCVDPSGLSTLSVTPSYAELSWTENGGATSWEIRLGDAGFDTTNVIPAAISTNPFTWTSLTPNSSYDWYVRANCGGGTFSSWVGPHTFVTPDVGSNVLPFTEDWESYNGVMQVNGMMYTGTNYTWEFETDNPSEGRARWGTNAYQTASGSGALTFDKAPNDGDYAINCAILTLDLSAFTSDDLELAFSWTDHKDEEHVEDGVWIRGNNTAQWVRIFNFDPVDSPDGVFQNVTGLDIDNTLSNASPPQIVSATFQVKFGQKDNSFTPGDGISIDDISITSSSAMVLCNTPSGLSTNFVAPSYAELAWTENGEATSWEIRLGPGGFDTTGVIPVVAGSNPFIWTNLTPNTNYEFYVRSICGGGTYSDWSEPFDFSTPNVGTDVLPFLEDWETDSGMSRENGLMYAGSNYQWAFETDNSSEGRVRWGTHAYAAGVGSGSLTLDKYPNDGDYATNSVMLTLDLSAFTAHDIDLGFLWTDHSDEEHAEDKVWVRGNNTAQWVDIYDFNPANAPNGVFQQVSDLDVDEALANASPPQTVSATFQLKFVQKDNSFTPGDGISIDEISITSPSGVAVCDDPSDQSETFVAPTYADLLWVEHGSASNWEIRLGTTGFDTTGITPVSAGSNPYTYSGLTANTTYDWYVRARCEGELNSGWIGPRTFATPDDTGEVLPFTEDWESSSGILKTNALIYSGNSYSWQFETDNPNEGRVRWGTNAYLPNTGTGALSLDKHPNDGDFATNAAILTIDLSAYQASDLVLSLWWTDHNDEDQLEDKIWIRGDNSQQWVQIYDFDPTSYPDGSYQEVTGLDIDQTLANASPSQTVSTTFQVKFGQKDNSFSPGDGISIDDITIASPSAPKESVFSLPGDDEPIRIYAHNGWLYLECNEESSEEVITLQLIDIFGIVIFQAELPPGKRRSHYIGYDNSYFVVKAILQSRLITRKLYFR
jgi:hypothetical protein